VSFVESEFAFHFNRLLQALNSRFSNPLYEITPFTTAEKNVRESAAFLDKLAFDAIKVNSRRKKIFC
jgi:hypothetical protein